MAILQISRIQVRQGRQIDLPQLSGGEFGWSNDSRQLFIGNGSLDEGAPVVGNTEVLTEFSDISPQVQTALQDLAGNLVQTPGTTTVLLDNTSTATVIATVSVTDTPAFRFEYTITRGSSTRIGSILVATNSSALLNSQDTGVENAITGVTLSVAQTGTNVSVKYTTTGTGTNAILKFAISYFG